MYIINICIDQFLQTKETSFSTTELQLLFKVKEDDTHSMVARIAPSSAKLDANILNTWMTVGVGYNERIAACCIWLSDIHDIQVEIARISEANAVDLVLLVNTSNSLNCDARLFPIGQTWTLPIIVLSLNDGELIKNVMLTATHPEIKVSLKQVISTDANLPQRSGIFFRNADSANALKGSEVCILF